MEEGREAARERRLEGEPAWSEGARRRAGHTAPAKGVPQRAAARHAGAKPPHAPGERRHPPARAAHPARGDTPRVRPYTSGRFSRARRCHGNRRAQAWRRRASPQLVCGACGVDGHGCGWFFSAHATSAGRRGADRSCFQRGVIRATSGRRWLLLEPPYPLLAAQASDVPALSGDVTRARSDGPSTDPWPATQPRPTGDPSKKAGLPHGGLH